MLNLFFCSGKANNLIVKSRKGKDHTEVACRQESVQARNPPWLWNPGQTSPEVQNRGASGPTKRTYVLQKFKKEKKKITLKPVFLYLCPPYMSWFYWNFLLNPIVCSSSRGKQFSNAAPVDILLYSNYSYFVMTSLMMSQAPMTCFSNGTNVTGDFAAPMKNTVTSLSGCVLFSHVTTSAAHQVTSVYADRGRVTLAPSGAVTEVGWVLVVNEVVDVGRFVIRIDREEIELCGSFTCFLTSFSHPITSFVTWKERSESEQLKDKVVYVSNF